MAIIHPKDSAEPANKDRNKTPSKKTKDSSKRRKKSGNKTDLVDQDNYTFMSRKLSQMTPLERAFGTAYVNNIGVISARNEEDYAIAVAIDIGIEDYNAKSWSKNVLKESCVQHYINNLSRSQLKAQEITKERILAEYARIAFGNIGEVVELKGGKVKIKDFDDMSEDAMASIHSISETKGETTHNVKITQHDKMKALEVLAKHEGLVDENGMNDSPEVIAIRALEAAKIMAEMTGGE